MYKYLTVMGRFCGSTENYKVQNSLWSDNEDMYNILHFLKNVMAQYIKS